MTGLVAIAYAIATTAAAWITDTDRYDAPRATSIRSYRSRSRTSSRTTSPTCCYTGQDIIRLASDPFDRHWDLFGTVDFVPHLTLLSPDTINWTKIGGVIIGHVIAVTLAHDRAIEDNDHAHRRQESDTDARRDGRVYRDRACGYCWRECNKP
jgi:hypothetical protein